VHLALAETQRVEIGGEVADHTIGADQHEGADAVLRRAQGGGRRQLEAGAPGAHLQGLAHLALHLAPVAGEGPDQLAVALLLDPLQRLGPGRAMAVALAAPPRLFLMQAGEEMPPLVADGARVALVLLAHVLDVGGIGALQEGGARKGFVLGLACHGESTFPLKVDEAGSHAEMTTAPTRGAYLPQHCI
jgi:hypothetical protein